MSQIDENLIGIIPVSGNVEPARELLGLAVQLLLLLDCFALHSRRTSELIELLLQLVNRGLLRFDQGLAGSHVIRDGKVGCHP